MNDSEYHRKVDDLLMSLEESWDDLAVDIDFEAAGGILTLIFVNGSKIIFNKQAPLHQLWVATKFNGHHFTYENGQWIDERTGAEFWAFIDEAASKQAGQAVSFR